MATNNFKPFATGAGANVTSQADYESLSALASGFQAGKASSAQINKALRQSSSMAAMLGQFISSAGMDAIDNGNAAVLLNNFLSALTNNLSLGNASKRNVGSGVNQVPDMGYFSNLLSDNGYQKLPGGLIVQWGQSGQSVSQTGLASGTFPIQFPNGCFLVTLTEQTTPSGSTPHAGVNCWGLGSLNNSGFVAICAARLSNAAAVAEAVRYLAIGF